jgi:hypothetical protein
MPISNTEAERDSASRPSKLGIEWWMRTRDAMSKSSSAIELRTDGVRSNVPEKR